MIVFVECYHDAALVRALGVANRDLRHAGCKGDVVNSIRKTKMDAIGLVDADPEGGPAPSDMKNYRTVAEEHGIRLLERQQRPSKRLLVIYPRLEEWLIARARAVAIDPAGTSYGLPKTARDMHRNPRCDRKKGFGPFLHDLIAADSGMRFLKRCLRADQTSKD